MKYIDAEKLYAKVDALMAHYAKAEKEMEDDVELSIFYQGKRKMCSEVISLINSLQQEQPATYDEAYLNEKIAKATKSWEGVDVDKFMDEVRGREPEVDLEKEVEKYFQGLWPGMETAEQCNTDMHFTPPAIMRLASHFYELGKNAK